MWSSRRGISESRATGISRSMRTISGTSSAQPTHAASAVRIDCDQSRAWPRISVPVE